MKVTFLTRYNKEPLIPRFNDQLVRTFAGMDNIDVHVISFGNETANLDLGDLQVHLIHAPNKYLVIPSLPHIIGQFKYRIEKIKPDIVHAFGTFLPYSTLLTRLNDYPRVLSVIGIKRKEMDYLKGNWLSNRINVLNEKYTLSRIPNLIVESAANKEILSEMTKSQIYVVPIGIEFGQIQRMEVPAGYESPHAFYIGGLLPIKGVDLLIKATQWVRKSFPQFQLVIAGKGPQANQLQGLITELNLNANVRLAGFISEQEKYSYYKNCQFMVVPSRWDFSPITICEAMACGRPVIASTRTNSEIIEDGVNGFLFESENVEDLAHKMISLLQDDNMRDRMGKAAIEAAREYDWGIIARKTLQVYEEIIHQTK